MDKRYLHRVWRRIRSVSYWYFLVGFILSLVVAVGALRDNNLKMIELREAVVEADKSGQDVNQALARLREHVHSHMNTDLTSGDGSIYPPIQLKYTHERLIRSEQERVAAINRKVQEDAVSICERRFGSGRLGERVQCVQDYITANSIQSAGVVPKELYQFAFVSPRWSPDLAGWSLVAASVFLLLFVARLGLEKWFRHKLKQHV